jgi:uncharacterized lipoprotein YbaY
LNLINDRLNNEQTKYVDLFFQKCIEDLLDFHIFIESSILLRSASEMVRRTLCGVIENTANHCVLNADDVVIVTLCDTTLWDWTRIDFPHIPHRFIVSNVKLDDCDYFPIPFTLYYNDEEIDPNLCYGIRCDVLDKSNEIKYSSEQFIPVLTDKHPKTNVHITVGPRNIPSTSRKYKSQE